MTATNSRIVDNAECLLELLQKIAVLLDCTLRRTVDPVMLEVLRGILADVMDHWAAVSGDPALAVAWPDERRHEERLHVLGELTVVDRKDQEEIHAECINWSSGGLCALIDRVLMPGGDYAIHFRLLGSNEPLSVRGKVRWCLERASRGSARVGFEFHD